MEKDRHVIKGRGKHRGKYLCYARHAPAETPTEDGFVWLAAQRKAARWADPRYNGHTWSTARARLHNGYFVKLVAPKEVVKLVPELQSYITEHAIGASVAKETHWFDGDFHSSGENFCLDCAEKLVDQKYAADPKRFEDLFDECETADDRYRVAIDGGFDIEHDGIPWCATCGAKLSGSLSDYGANEEIAALTGKGALIFRDAEGWDALERATINLCDDDPRWRHIAKVVERARLAERENADREAALAASPGMAEIRGEFLSILAVRKEQKAPEPSFSMWTEMLVWRRRSRETRVEDPEEKALEKRMIAEAKIFASCLGMRWHWSCSLFMIKAPYGTYYWPFIVQIEQYRLWNTPAFQEGCAHALRPPSDDQRYRDANPYPSDDERHTQWDAGYIASFNQ